MANSSHPLVKLNGLQQVCMVVRNADRTMESMWNIFGIGPWNVFVVDDKTMRDTTYHGKPTRYSFKAAMCHQMAGGLQIELIEPLEGDNIYRDYLNEHGEGVQHMGWHKVYSLDAFNETKRALEKAGFPCIMGGVMYSNTSERAYVGSFGYFDTTRVLNTALEVLEVTWSDPSKSSNPPTYVFPK